MKIKFKDLPDADLIVGCIYEGGSPDDGVRGRGADVLSKLLNVDNSGGFRKRKREDDI